MEDATEKSDTAAVMGGPVFHHIPEGCGKLDLCVE
jgi:hypothetical protein